MKPVYLIDASIYIFRAYFSLPETITDPEGRPCNAVYGFANFLHRFIHTTKAHHIGVAFDKSLTTSFRNQIYPQYKANRELPPAELEYQLGQCETLVQNLGLAKFASKVYEADDLIGSLAYIMRGHGHTIRIVSSDKDLAQLIGPKDQLWDFAKDIRYNPAAIRHRFGVRPAQIVDLLALTGDVVDNIPGVPGIGPKTAAQLLNAYGDINKLYRNIEAIPKLKLRGAERIQSLLIQYRDQVYLAYRLCRIVTNIRLSSARQRLKRKKIKHKKLIAQFNQLGFGDRLRQKMLSL